MFDFRRRIVPIILAFAFAGCSDSTEPINLRVGLFVVDNVQLSALLHYPSRGMEEELRLDNTLESAIAKAFRRVYSSVDILESYPTQQTTDSKHLDFVVIAEVLGGGGSVGHEGSQLWNRGEADHSLSVKLIFYTHEMKQVTSVKASGAGSGESIRFLFTAEKNAADKAIKAAMRSLGDDIVQQVHVNPDIRNIAKQSRK
ncbi:MAG: hypothetical protein OXT74_04375 [Candidatus Poribacteria bacterium]|nr:hypothetical protein [Candidatus Poribacteria bacterium]